MKEKKKITMRIVGAIFVICMVTSLAGNIILWQQNDWLKNSREKIIQNRNEIAAELEQTKEELRSEIETLTEENKFQETLLSILEEENNLFREVTLQAAKEKAKEDGFNPEACDWFLNSEGHWCFFY